MPTIKTPAKRNTSSRSRSSKSKTSGFTLPGWAWPTITLVVGIALGSCTDAIPKTGQELTRFVETVLTSPQLKEKLGEVLQTTTPSHPDRSAEQTVSAPPAQRPGAEPFAECRQFFAGGQSPILTPRPQQRPLCYEAFAILHSGQTKTPVFVAQRLNRRSVADADEARTDKFFADARLPKAERADLEDYRNSGYSRGHMAPAGDMSTPAAMAQSFSLANMVPQAQKHNGGAWSKIEQDTRKYAQRAAGDVFVITGPVYSSGNSQSIGAGKVRVPDYIFKLVYDEAGHRAWAHWHRNSDDEHGGQPISYREFVKRTGIEFLPGADLK